MIRMHSERLLILTVLMLMALDCAPHMEKSAPERQTAPQQGEAKSPHGVSPKTNGQAPQVKGHLFQVDPAASQIRILVYRSGRLAHVGHNHVISSKNVRGTILLADGITASRVALQIPVNKLIVDDPELRKQIGEGFETQPSELDISDTLRSMLSARVLDATLFPAVTLNGEVMGGKLPDLDLEVEITIRSVTQRLTIPVKLERMQERVTASGEFAIRQSDFGIEPFSILAGALVVEDEIKVQYRVIGRRGE